MIICGKTHAKDLLEKLRRKIDLNYPPSLVVIMVGDNAASKIYIQKKQQACHDLGIKTQIFKLSSDTTATELSNLIERLNNDSNVHGILLQLPLPSHLSTADFLYQINPIKDVDGLHPENLGLLAANNPRFIPCTPQGCLQLINSVMPNLTGKNAVVVGRSVLVGKPMGMLLTNHNATVTLAHSYTTNLPDICQQADILVAAVGKSLVINKNFIKKDAVVIDVGINRLPDGKIVGDVDFNAIKEMVSFITPVPGGVGPMTIANLLYNTVKAQFLQNNLPIARILNI